VAFSREHEFCGQMDGDVDHEPVSMTRNCGALIVRAPEPSS